MEGKDIVSIDGSHMEGGGQIIRTAVGLSALTSRPVEISNIRAGRPRPGLMAQHLEGIKAAAQLTGGRLEGGKGTWRRRLSEGEVQLFLDQGGVGDGAKFDDLHDQATLPVAFYHREIFADAEVVLARIKDQLNDVTGDLLDLDGHGRGVSRPSCKVGPAALAHVREERWVTGC